MSGQADLSRDLGEHGWWVLRASVNGFRQSVLVLHRKLQADLTEARPIWPPRRSACSSRPWPAASGGRWPTGSARPTAWWPDQ